MANRYWVGGTGTWNTTSKTNWSATSGGASGASVPTVADSVFFDQAGTYTVTMTGALACLDITVSAGTVTFATGTTPTLNVRGSVSLIVGTVWSSTGTITFSSTTTGRTIDFGNSSLSCNFVFNGIGGGWTLSRNLSTTGTITLTNGTFSTGSGPSYNLTTSQITSAGSGTFTLNLNASTITITSSLQPWYTVLTTLTLNAGTSQITFSGNGGAVTTGSVKTFYNVSFTGITGAVPSTIDSNIFNNLTFSRPFSGSNVYELESLTINGTLSFAAGNGRVMLTGPGRLASTLKINAVSGFSDVDFNDIYVIGAAAPLSGTRIGDAGNVKGVSTSTPKTVYWNLPAGGDWSSTTSPGWALSSGGAVSKDNFPLPQDTAIIENTGLNSGATITLNGWSAVEDTYIGTIDMSTRSLPMTLAGNSDYQIYGNWKFSSSVTNSFTGALYFSATQKDQYITSAGKSFSSKIVIDIYEGSLKPLDAFNQASLNDFEMRTGTFDTNDMTVSISALKTSSTTTYGGAPIAIFLRSSLFTVKNNVTLDFAQNLTIDAGTSTLISSAGNASLNLGGFTYNNISFTSSGTSNTTTISGNNTFKDFSCTAPVSAGYMLFSFSENQTITGTLTCAGATAVRRIFLFSDTIGTQRTLTVNSISANDCDFRDISLAGAASGASPTRASDCGGNSGITFPAPKTVYWNLAGAQNWSATGWATSSGGAPALNNFPLAQDTAVFDNTGSVTGTITINVSWNIGTFDSSTRTSAMTLSTSTNGPSVYGDWKFGTGITSTSGGIINFRKNGTQTITSNGIQFGCPVTINNPFCTVQLADALSLNSARTLSLNGGIFDAVTYNVTVGAFSNTVSSSTLRMGSGTWTLSGTGSVWFVVGGTPTHIVGTSTIVLSNTTTTARTFAGNGLYYNKLTIGGATGTSTLTITGANTFGELASTKTVAHTIIFPSSTTTTIGKWSVTGTLGNVVTLSPSTAATAYTLSIAGPATTGINYLSISYCTVSSTSPGEFYVGVNSTNTAGNTGAIFFTATPAPRTLYWVGGTGNWSSTTKWSTSSGGGSGAAIPTSLDAVNFDSLSNATAYTAGVDVFARCASFTMAGPASGNVTFSGTSGIAFHGNVSFAATGITRTYSGNMSLAGNSSYTFTTNGLTLGSATTVTGIGATWTLGFALNIGGSNFTVTYGSFSTSASNYALTAGNFSSDNSNVRSVSWNGSSLTLSSSATLLMATTTNLTFAAGTSTISCSGASSTFNGGGLTFNNVSFTSAAATGITITGASTFNTLSFAGRTTVGITPVTFSANQTISTLTLNAGTTAAYRTFLASDTIGTQRTLTVTTLTAGAADYDFRDIAIAGGAAPIAPTRAGDCKGNSGITFPGAKTVYYRNTGSANWGTTFAGSWSPTSGAPSDSTQFPLAQDTAVFPSTTFPGSGATTTINANYNIGTIDMSGRTGSPMTLATSTNTPTIYGNWSNGTGITLSGSGLLTFAGRASQTITSAGKSFTQALRVNSKNGTVSLQDALVATSTTGLTLISGTFDAQIYNVTLSGDLEGTSSEVRALNFGSGTWTLSGASATGINLGSADTSNLTISGSGTISVANNTTFCQIYLYGKDFSNITFNSAGSRGFQLISSLPVTIKNITNTYSATGATSIDIGNTGVFTFKSFTATGATGRVLTLTGYGNNGPTSIVLDDNVASGIDYLSISGIRAYPSQNAWYAGANSTNLGSLGWQFQDIPVNYGKFFLMFG